MNHRTTELRILNLMDRVPAWVYVVVLTAGLCWLAAQF